MPFGALICRVYKYKLVYRCLRFKQKNYRKVMLILLFLISVILYFRYKPSVEILKNKDIVIWYNRCLFCTERDKFLIKCKF